MDLSEDGKSDRALGPIANSMGSIAIMPGIGRGALGPAATDRAMTRIRELAAADFDRDGGLDTAPGDEGDPVVFLNGGRGTLKPAVVWRGASCGARSLAVAGFNNDEKTDVAIRHDGTPGLRIMLDVSR